VRQRAESDAKTYGYYLNPDPEFLRNLLEGLKSNEERYGYPSCPCRLASGKLEFDRDIICPCDYRDPDVEEYGACYCALYVRKLLQENPLEHLPQLLKNLQRLERDCGTADNAATSASVKNHHTYVPYAGQKKRCLLK